MLERTKIVIPSAFDSAAVTALLEASDSDPRLFEAASRATNGELAQYLAGAPALLNHYQDAPTTAAKALLTLAMDLRRLGHGPALPEALLEAGTPAYLTDREWDGLDEDWFGPLCTTPSSAVTAPTGR